MKINLKTLPIPVQLVKQAYERLNMEQRLLCINFGQRSKRVLEFNISNLLFSIYSGYNIKTAVLIDFNVSQAHPVKSSLKAVQKQDHSFYITTCLNKFG